MKRIKRPFAVIAFSLLTAFGVLMVYSEKLLLCLILISAIFCIFTAVLQKSVSKVWLLICVCLVTASLLFETAISVPQYVNAISAYDVEVSGILISYPVKTEGTSSYFVISDAQINGFAIEGKINVYAPLNINLTPGDKISFTASELSPVASDGLFRYHTLSEKTYLNAFTYDEIEITEIQSGKNIFTKILQLKKFISDKYSENLSGDSSALVNALIAGDKSLLSSRMDYSFRICGISHIFAVSGMHLSLWTGIFFVFLRQRAKVSFIPNLAAIIFVLFYCAFTGFSPSVLRSGIMLVTLFISKLLRRHSDPINTWGISGTALMLTNPFLAGNISFLLSFTATFAMLFFNSYILPKQNIVFGKHIFLRKRIHSVKSSILVSLSVLLVTLPLNALFFGYVSLLSPLSSLLLSPIAEGIMITSGFSAVIPAENCISSFFFLMTDFLCNTLLAILDILQNLDFMTPAVDLEIILPFFIVSAFTVALIVKYTKNNRAAIKCILLSMILLTSAVIADYHIHIGETRIFIPDAGNATIIAVTRDDAKAFVYGSGGPFSACADTVNYLNRKGIFKIDKLFIPRYKSTESLNTDYLSDKIFPEDTVSLYKTGEKYTYRETLWKSTEIYSETSSDFSASVLYIDDIKVVICSLPTSDFSSGNTVFSKGDILICRSRVPLTLSEDNFGTVIVMTDCEADDAAENVFYTVDTNTEIIIKGDSYAVNR